MPSEDRVIGYVVLTKRIGVDEDWFLDHAGEAWSHEEAVVDAAKWGHDNPGYQCVVAAVVLPEEES